MKMAQFSHYKGDMNNRQYFQNIFEVTEEQMREQYTKEIQLLRKGLSLRNVSAITSTSVNTLRKLKEIGIATTTQTKN